MFTLRVNRELMLKNAFLFISAILFYLIPSCAAARTIITADEFRLLPRYCQDSQAVTENWNDRNKRQRWENSMGAKNFSHMHHYCWALNGVAYSRKSSLTQQERVQVLLEASNDYRYVINNCTPDFVLLPEVYTRLGEVELMRRLPDRANQAFRQARSLKPDYWPAYSRWAEYLMDHGQRTEALKIVREGLEHSPEARPLLELYRTLGGKPSDIPPKPIEHSQTDTAPAPQDQPVEKDQAGSVQPDGSSKERAQ